MKQSKILSVLLAVLTACLVLSSSVAVPILCRPFYYAHIGPLGLVQATGLTEEAIRQAYDEMLDFCLGAPEFSTGALSWSQSGRDHFADVRVLFLLDLAVLALSAALLLLWFLLGDETPHKAEIRLGARIREQEADIIFYVRIPDGCIVAFPSCLNGLRIKVPAVLGFTGHPAVLEKLRPGVKLVGDFLLEKSHSLRAPPIA